MEQQLNLFEEQVNSVSSITQNLSTKSTTEDRVSLITVQEELQAPAIEVEADSFSTDEIPSEPVKLAYEEGDLVKIIIPSEEENSEIFWWINSYFSHLKNAKGRIIRVLPYSRLQYEVEFDVKHEDNRITMYHEHLTWLSS